MRDIEVRIDRLVLHGVPASEREAVVQALTAEIETSLETGGLRPELLGQAGADGIDGFAATIEGPAGAGELGRAVGRAIGERLGVKE